MAPQLPQAAKSGGLDLWSPQSPEASQATRASLEAKIPMTRRDGGTTGGP